MAMNKKEKAALAAARKQAALSHALRWSVPLGESLGPDVPAPKSGEPDTVGYTTCAHRVVSGFGTQVGDALDGVASGSHLHWRTASPRSRSKGGVPVYSTRLRALRGLRAELECIFAGKLAAVDDEIAREAMAMGSDDDR